MATVQTHSSAPAMAKAAERFVRSLSDDQRDKTVYEYMDGERIFWYYPPLNRHGLPLRDMDDDQRQLAYSLMETGLTEESFEKAKLIIEHESVLGPLEKEAGVTSFVRDPDLYYWTVFGDPGSDDEPWGWRVEGHHVSLNFSLWRDRFISMTPFFFGANPAEVRKGPKKGLRILDDREDLAFELMDSLDKGQTSTATIYGEAPYDILTYKRLPSVAAAGRGPACVQDERHPEGHPARPGKGLRQPGADRYGAGQVAAPGVGGIRRPALGLGRPRRDRQGALLPDPRRQLRGRVRQPAERRQPHTLRLARRRKRLRQRRAARTPAAVPRPLIPSPSHSVD